MRANVLQVPRELVLFDVYVPPFLLVCALGLIGAVAVAQILNWTGLSKYFWHPPLALLALWVLSSSLVGLFFIAP